MFLWVFKVNEQLDNFTAILNSFMVKIKVLTLTKHLSQFNIYLHVHLLDSLHGVSVYVTHRI